jgi:monoamine oxidase
MSKTSFFQVLRRAARIATVANRERLQPVEAIERYQQRISRRQLFQTSLAATGALTAVAIDRQMSRAIDRSIDPVLIVGAGIAGLTAGYYLHRAGVPIRIIEASNRVGGRIHSKSSAVGTASTIELGGEFIDSGHQTIRKLALELGLDVVDLEASDTGLQTEIHWFDRRSIDLTIGEVNYKSANLRAKQLDRVSIKTYLEKYCPDPILRRWIEVAYTNEYGLPVHQQSAINLLLLIGKDGQKIEIFGSSDQRYQIRGGNQQLVDRLATKLANFIETGTSLTSMRSTPNGRYRVINSRQQMQVYERVILALPFSVLRQIQLDVKLPPVKQQAIQKLGYGHNTKVITGYRDRLWRNKYGSNGQVFGDLDILQETWESGRYTSKKDGAIVNFTGGELGQKLAKLTATIAGNKFVADFQKVFPGVENGYLNRSIVTDWLNSPYSRGSYGCYLVGQWTQFAGVEGERVGNLFFVGEHCSVEAQGYMEGGCATGMAAAKEIIRELKID